MKRCSACLLEKPESEFSRKGDGLQSRRKRCFADYHRRYYERNKPLYMAKNRRNKSRQPQRLKAILLAAKRRPCSDCGGTFHPWVMESDHLDADSRRASAARSALRFGDDDLGGQRAVDGALVCDLL